MIGSQSYSSAPIAAVPDAAVSIASMGRGTTTGSTTLTTSTTGH